MLALIFTRNRRPMIIGSDSGWLMLAGRIARPRAISLRTSSAGQVLADRHELHLGRDDALAGVVHLGDVAPAAEYLARARQRQARRVLADRRGPVVFAAGQRSTGGVAPAGRAYRSISADGSVYGPDVS